MSQQQNDQPVDYEYAWPPYGADATAQQLRTFDLRTCDERMQTWLAALEQRQEADRQRIAHLERTVHRLLNPSEEPDGEEVAGVDFWSELSDAEQQRIRALAFQQDAAIGAKPGTSLSAFIDVAMKHRTVQP